VKKNEKPQQSESQELKTEIIKLKEIDTHSCQVSRTIA